jgi:hypothetical protein
MIALSRTSINKSTIKSLLLDISALGFIYLVPTISHLISLPLYLIEPMRLMLILALAHTTKRNAYLLALTMPVFSFLISGHPIAPKMILIALELSINVFLFYLLIKKFKNSFASILISIVISKAFYYFIKFYLIHFMIINTEIFATPILIQFITTIIFGLYLFYFYPRSAKRQ